MKHDVRFAGSVCIVVIALSVLVWAPVRAAAAPDGLTFTVTAERPYGTPTGPWTSRAVRTPALDEEDLEKAAASSVRTFTHSVEARGKTYNVTMVGSDPFVKGAPKVVVPMQIIPVRFEFDDAVLDPSLPNPDCAGGSTAVSRVMESPLVSFTNYGDGKRQYQEEVRRFEFWSLTGAPGAINPSYSVRFSAAALPTVTVKAHGFTSTGAACGRFGFFDLNTWETLVRTEILPALRSQGVNPRTFPLFLTLNVLFFDGDLTHCCALGYHRAFNTGNGVQTYAVAAYDISRTIPNGGDISVLSQEIAGWYDDPFGSNPTPSWSHVGQTSGCHESLEAGDPLTGKERAVTMANGFTYHPQEIAFFSWFYNQIPSLGLKGWYSSAGSLRTPARLCR